MTIDDIRTFLEENKDDVEVKALVAELAPQESLTPEKVKEYVLSDDGKSIVQPMIDSAVTKAVKTRDRAHEAVVESEVKKRVAAKMLELNPEEAPWQRETRELKEQLDKERAERERDKLKRQLVEEAAAKGVKPFWVDDYLPESIEVGRLFLQKIADHEKELVTKATNERLAQESFKPSVGKAKDSGKIDFSKLSPEELIRMDMSGELDTALSQG